MLSYSHENSKSQRFSENLEVVQLCGLRIFEQINQHDIVISHANMAIERTRMRRRKLKLESKLNVTYNYWYVLHNSNKRKMKKGENVSCLKKEECDRNSQVRVVAIDIDPTLQKLVSLFLL